MTSPMLVSWERIKTTSVAWLVGLPIAVAVALNTPFPGSSPEEVSVGRGCEAGALLDLHLLRAAAHCPTWTEPTSRSEVYSRAHGELVAAGRSLRRDRASAKATLDLALDLWLLGNRMAQTGDVPGSGVGAAIAYDASEVVLGVVEHEALALAEYRWLEDELEALGEEPFDVDALLERELAAERERLGPLFFWRRPDAGGLRQTAAKIAAAGGSVEGRQAVGGTLEGERPQLFLHVVNEAQGVRNRALGLAVASRVAWHLRGMGCPEDVDRVVRAVPSGGVLLDPLSCSVRLWDAPHRSPLVIRPHGAPTFDLQAGAWSGRGVRADFFWRGREQESVGSWIACPR